MGGNARVPSPPQIIFVSCLSADNTVYLVLNISVQTWLRDDAE